MAKQGWICLHRKLQDNPLWREQREFSRAEAWIDILMEARWNKEPAKILIRGTVYACNRGQCLYSLETWADRWGWTKSRARKYLTLLQKMGQIDTERDTRTTRLTVCNFDTYQLLDTEWDTLEAHRRHAGSTQAVPNLISKEGNKGNKKAISPEKGGATVSDFDIFWDLYAKKEGRKPCVALWLKCVVRPGVPLGTILDGVHRYNRSGGLP